jgi:hypothetical protein
MGVRGYSDIRAMVGPIDHHGCRTAPSAWSDTDTLLLPPFPDADSGVGDSGWRSLSLPLQTGVAVRGPEY